jgi:hypothetical protein
MGNVDHEEWPNVLLLRNRGAKCTNSAFSQETDLFLDTGNTTA